MPLTITDFIEQVDGISTEDIPLDERERINDALADLTGGPGGTGAPVNDDAILVSKSLDDREGFNSIQSAVDSDSVSAGNTIFVEPGEYSESVTIDVEDLTLKAADGEKPTISGQTQNNASGVPAIDIRADGVTIEGFSVERVLDDASESTSLVATQAVKVGGFDAAGGSNVDIVDNEITVEDNTAEKTHPFIAGIAVLDSQDGGSVNDVTIDGNSVSGFTEDLTDGNQAAGVFVGGFYGDSVEASITNNDISNNEVGLSIGENVDTATGISGNTFTADGEEGETYVFDPNDAVDLDTVETDNSFPGPAPVTGTVAINPNQPGDHTTAVGGMAIEQTDGTLTLLQQGDSLDYASDATLLYVSDGNGTGVSAQSADRSRAFQFPVDDQGNPDAFGEVGETATAREGVDQLDGFSPIGDSDDVFESDSGEEIVVINVDEEQASEGLAVITLQEQ